jgi:uncharacterized protein YjiS (DUF1127 family)
MTTQALRTFEAALLQGIAAHLHSIAVVLASAAVRYDRWSDARRRRNDARLLLHSMSDRELRDIGLDRGVIDYVANDWQR